MRRCFPDQRFLGAGDGHDVVCDDELLDARQLPCRTADCSLGRLTTLHLQHTIFGALTRREFRARCIQHFEIAIEVRLPGRLEVR